MNQKWLTAAMAVVSTLTLTAVACFAQGTTEPPETQQTAEPQVVCESANAAGMTLSIGGERVYVDWTPVRRSLTGADISAIECFMRKHGCVAQMPNAQNRAALKNALTELLETNVCHLPLVWPGDVYVLTYQTLTQKKVFWVDLPARAVRIKFPPLRPETPETPNPLRLTPGPTPPGPEIQPIRVNLQTPTLQLPPVEVARQVVWVQQAPASASRSLLVPERLPAAPTVTAGPTLGISIGGVFGVPETRVSASATGGSATATGGNASSTSSSSSSATATAHGGNGGTGGTGGTGGAGGNGGNGGNGGTCPPLPGPPPQPPPAPPGVPCPPLLPGGPNQVVPNPGNGQVGGNWPWAPVQPPPSAAGGP